MLPLELRAQIRKLLSEGCTKARVARELHVSLSTIKRIAREPVSRCADDASERRRRRIGRPSVTAEYRTWLAEALRLRPWLRTTQLLVLARRTGYSGGKTTFYQLAASVRRDLAAIHDRETAAMASSSSPAYSHAAGSRPAR